MQFFEKDSIIQQVQFESEQIRSELQLKIHQLQDMSESVKDLKKELNSQRDQKKHLEDQVSVVVMQRFGLLPIADALSFHLICNPAQQKKSHKAESCISIPKMFSLQVI